MGVEACGWPVQTAKNNSANTWQAVASYGRERWIACRRWPDRANRSCQVNASLQSSLYSQTAGYKKVYRLIDCQKDVVADIATRETKTLEE